MDTTTIQISRKLKEKINSFGMKGESYDTILSRIYKAAVQVQLREFLSSSSNFIPIEQAIKNAEKRWSK